MATCWLCGLQFDGQIGRGRKARCPECASRAKKVSNVKILLQPCSICGIKGSWLMEERDGKPICGNCARIQHHVQAAKKGSIWWPRQCQIDILKTVTKCKKCGENYPDKLIFVDDNLQRIHVSTKISRKRLTARIHDAEVYCWNCWRTERRNHA